MTSIAVIDPATRVAELDCFNYISSLAKIPCTYHLPALFGMSSLNSLLAEPAALIILGSGASVHDGLPWQAPLNQWLLPRLFSGSPILGLCYGHQLIAHLVGAEVTFASPDHKKYRGTRTLNLNPSSLGGGTLELVVSHKEIVPNCPAHFTALATHPRFGCEAFVHESLPVFGFQAHPEATRDFLSNNSISLEEPAQTRALTQGHQLIANFLGLLG